MTNRLQHKIATVFSFLSIFCNLLQPFVFALSMPTLAHADESVVEESTPAATEAPTPTASPEETVAPTPEPSTSRVESIAPSPSPEVATPEPSPSLAPSPTPTSTPAPTNPEPSQEITPSPSATSSPTPTPTTLNEELHATILENTDADSASLATDKTDYAPTDTALITGSGFLANATYSLTISSDDVPATSTTVSISTDGEGKLFYAYQLDGNYRPNYRAVVRDVAGTIVATVTFTDSRWVLGATLNGGSSVSVAPSATVSANVQVLTWLGLLDPNANWRSTSYQIGSNPVVCVDTPNHNSFLGNIFTDSFPITAPATPGTYDITFKAFANNTCNSGGISFTFTLDNGLTVEPVIVPLSDLTATKSSTVTGDLTLGNTFTWNIHIENAGTKKARFERNEVIFTDELPEGATYTNLNYNWLGTSGQGIIACVLASNTITCTATGSNNTQRVGFPVGSTLDVSVDVTPTLLGALINPRLGGICQVDPADNVNESEEDNNSCTDTVNVIEAPALPPNSNGGGNNTDGGSSVQGTSAPTPCTDLKPGTPTLRSAIPGENTVLLNWLAGSGPLTYYLVAYGLTPGSLTYGNPNIGGEGTTSYLVASLSGGTTYYFQVRAGNGCATGEFSNILAATPRGTVTTTLATGFTEGVLGESTDAENQGEETTEIMTGDGLSGDVLGNAQDTVRLPWWYWLIAALVGGSLIFVWKRPRHKKRSR